MKSDINVDRLRRQPAAPGPQEKARVPRHKPGQQFLKGPIPWAWLCAAAGLGGKSLHVGIELWHLVSMSKSARFPLSRRRGEDLGVQRHAAYRALIKLEKAGLVTVQRHAGRLPIVTVLGAPNSDPSGGI